MSKVDEAVAKQYRQYDSNNLDIKLVRIHVEAIAGEELWPKADIARELAYRDQQIAELNEEVQSLINNNRALCAKLSEATMV